MRRNTPQCLHVRISDDCSCAEVPASDSCQSFDYASCVADWILRAGVEEVVLTGANAVCCNSLPATITALSRGGVLVSIETDAKKADSCHGTLLREAGLARVVVQLDGATAELHDAFNDSPGLFDRAVEFIHSFRTGTSASGAICIRSTIAAETYLQLSDMVPVLADMGCSAWSWVPVRQRPFSLLTETQVREFYAEVVDLCEQCRLNSIELLLPSGPGSEPDAHIFGNTLDEVAASCVGVYPANYRCEVLNHTALVDLGRKTIQPCPIRSSSHDGLVRVITIEGDSLAAMWDDATNVSSREAFADRTHHTCTECPPEFRRAHEILIGRPSHLAQQLPRSHDHSLALLASIQSGGILLDYQCNAACQHCLYASDGKTKLRATAKTVDQIGSVLSIVGLGPRGLHLSGGEPFLDISLLTASLQIMKQHGIRVEFVETNGFWGRHRGRAAALLLTLRAAGLERVRFSCSPFHEQFIDRNAVASAIAVARKVLGEAGVFVFDRAALDAAPPTPVPFDLVPGGRAAYLLASTTRGQQAEDYTQPCGYELLQSGHAHFDAEGNVTPGICTGISIGHISDLRTLYDHVDVDSLPVVSHLLSGGAAALYGFARDRYGYLERPNGYVSKCHLCVDVRMHLVRQNCGFKELAPIVFYDGMERYVASEASSLVDLRWDNTRSESQL